MASLPAPPSAFLPVSSQQSSSALAKPAELEAFAGGRRRRRRGGRNGGVLRGGVGECLWCFSVSSPLLERHFGADAHPCKGVASSRYRRFRCYGSGSSGGNHDHDGGGVSNGGNDGDGEDDGKPVTVATEEPKPSSSTQPIEVRYQPLHAFLHEYFAGQYNKSMACIEENVIVYLKT
jgi:hypothetical protein